MKRSTKLLFISTSFVFSNENTFYVSVMNMYFILKKRVIKTNNALKTKSKVFTMQLLVLYAPGGTFSLVTINNDIPVHILMKFFAIEPCQLLYVGDGIRLTYNIYCRYWNYFFHFLQICTSTQPTTWSPCTGLASPGRSSAWTPRSRNGCSSRQRPKPAQPVQQQRPAYSWVCISPINGPIKLCFYKTFMFKQN